MATSHSQESDPSHFVLYKLMASPLSVKYQNSLSKLIPLPGPYQTDERLETKRKADILPSVSFYGKCGQLTRIWFSLYLVKSVDVIRRLSANLFNGSLIRVGRSC